MAISIEHAYFLAMILAAVFYGTFLVLYCGVVYILFFLRRDSQSKKAAAMFIVTVMLIVATVHLGVSYVRTVTALIDKRDAPGGATAYLNVTYTGSYMFQDALYAFQTLLGDAFIVYRLYVVYVGKKMIVIPACVLFAGSASVTIATLVLEGLAKPGSSLFTLNRWITTFVAFTFVTNFTCTGLIAYRLWSVERKVYKAKSNRYLTRIAVTVIESGALYSAFLVSLLVTYIKGDWNFFVPFLMLVHVIGIAFSLVMIRVGLGISFGDTSNVVVSDATSGPTRAQGNRGVAPNASFGMVHISRVTEVRQFDFETNSESDVTIQKEAEVEFDRRSQSSVSVGESEAQKAAALQ